MSTFCSGFSTLPSLNGTEKLGSSMPFGFRESTRVEIIANLYDTKSYPLLSTPPITECLSIDSVSSS